MPRPKSRRRGHQGYQGRTGRRKAGCPRIGVGASEKVIHFRWRTKCIRQMECSMRGVQPLKKQAPTREKACFVRTVNAQAVTPKSLQLMTKTHTLAALFVKLLCRFSLTIDTDQRTAKGVSMSVGKRVQTAAQRIGLEQAQIARREMRRSPLEQHRLHVASVLRWTHAWSQTTRKILLLVTGSSKSNFLSKLVEDGYMRCEKCWVEPFGRSISQASICCERCHRKGSPTAHREAETAKAHRG